MISRLDKHIARWFQNTHFPHWLDLIMRIVSRLGDYGAIWFVLAWIYATISSVPYLFLLLSAGLIIVIFIWEWLLKNIFRRKRPFHQLDDITSWISRSFDSYSFPSWHTSISWCSVMLLWLSGFFSTFPLLAVITIFLAILISLSRAYLRVHYFSDVFAGMVLWGMVGYLVYMYLYPLIIHL